MKAVVMEKRFLKAAVLKEDGTFASVFTSAGVGEEIEIRQSPGYSRVMKTALTAAAVFMAGFWGWDYMVLDAYAYVTMDAESSVEFTVNRLNQIISVDALDENSEEIAAVLNSELKGVSFETAMSETKVILTENHYLNEEAEDCILIDIVSDSEKEKESLRESAETVFGSETDHSVFTVSDTVQRQEAQEHGISTGKYRQITEIMEKEGSDQEFETYRNDTVEDLIKGRETDSGNGPANEMQQDPVNQKENHPDADIPQEEPEGPAEEKKP